MLGYLHFPFSSRFYFVLLRVLSRILKILMLDAGFKFSRFSFHMFSTNYFTRSSLVKGFGRCSIYSSSISRRVLGWRSLIMTGLNSGALWMGFSGPCSIWWARFSKTLFMYYSLTTIFSSDATGLPSVLIVWSEFSTFIGVSTVLIIDVARIGTVLIN